MRPEEELHGGDAEPDDLPDGSQIAGANRNRIRSCAALSLALACMALLAIAIAGWYFLRERAGLRPSDLKAVGAGHPEGALTLSPIVICTGVDPNGKPTGTAARFTQNQLRQTGILAFLSFSGAIPAKSTFQWRWKIGTRASGTPVYLFERAADSLRIKIDRDLPPGTLQVEFLVDGVSRQRTSVLIEPQLKKGAPNAEKAPVTVPVLETSISVDAPKEAQSEQPSAAQERAQISDSAAKAEKQREIPLQAAPPPVSRYQAKHWHSLGSCSGELKLTPQHLEFTSQQHTIKFDVHNVELHKDGIRDANGREWHFFIQGTNVELLLGKWLSGGLFPGALTGPVRVYEARHRHRLGNCSGQLTLTAESLEFSSPEHYIKSYVKTTQTEGDGILDRTGQRWRFDVQGEEPGALFRSWKNGTLFE